MLELLQILMLLRLVGGPTQPRSAFWATRPYVGCYRAEEREPAFALSHGAHTAATPFHEPWDFAGHRGNTEAGGMTITTGNSLFRCVDLTGLAIIFAT